MTQNDSSRLDSEAVAELHEQHASSLLRYLVALTGHQEDAQDCLQATFAVLQAKGGQCAVGARRAWLFRVAYHEAMQLIRRRKRIEKTTDSRDGTCAVEQAAADADLPLDGIVREERRLQVQTALRELPDELQRVVDLRINQGLRFREIAEVLGIPLGTALTRMQAALQKLGERLRET